MPQRTRITTPGSIRPALLGALSLLAIAPLVGCSAVSKLDGAQLFSRAGWQHPDRVIEALDVPPGARIADIGAGDGYFTFRLAEAVGENGRIYAVDVDPDAIHTLRNEIERRGIENVEVVLARENDPQLPDAGIDLAFVCNAYHHIDSRVAYFDRLRADLAPGGRLAILEGRDDWPSRMVAPWGHSTPRDVLIEELGLAGYHVREGYDFLPFQHFSVFATGVTEAAAR